MPQIVREGNEPGTWRRKDGEIYFTCPKCEYEGALDHDVDPSGKVTPSVVCPTEGCSYHEWLLLDGYAR